LCEDGFGTDGLMELEEFWALICGAAWRGAPFGGFELVGPALLDAVIPNF